MTDINVSTNYPADLVKTSELHVGDWYIVEGVLFIYIGNRLSLRVSGPVQERAIYAAHLSPVRPIKSVHINYVA